MQWRRLPRKQGLARFCRTAQSPLVARAAHQESRRNDNDRRQHASRLGEKARDVRESGQRPAAAQPECERCEWHDKQRPEWLHRIDEPSERIAADEHRVRQERWSASRLLPAKPASRCRNPRAPLAGSAAERPNVSLTSDMIKNARRSRRDTSARTETPRPATPIGERLQQNCQQGIFRLQRPQSASAARSASRPSRHDLPGRERGEVSDRRSTARRCVTPSA